MGVVIFGIDPGLANLGLAVATVEFTPKKKKPKVSKVIELEVITTKSDEKRGKLADDFERAMEISRKLGLHMSVYKPVIVCMEEFSLVRSSRTSSQTAMVYGVIADIVVLEKVPIIQLQAQGMKKVLAGKKTASKKEVQAALDGKIKNIPWPKTQAEREHTGDALGAIVASLPKIKEILL